MREGFVTGTRDWQLASVASFKRFGRRPNRDAVGIGRNT